MWGRSQKALKPNSQVTIADFYKKETPVGSPMAMRLSEETVRKELEAAGLTVTEKLAVLPYQYILIAQPTMTSSVPSPRVGQ